ETFWKLVRRIWRMMFAVRLHGSIFRNLNRARYLGSVIAGERVRVASFAEYQYPMAGVFPAWNLKFAPEGFNEIQAIFPADRFAAAFRDIVRLYERHDRAPEVCGVRRHKADPYLLSFAGDGLSFGLAFALAGLGPEELERFRRDIVERVLSDGGKVYLSKFPY